MRTYNNPKEDQWIAITKRATASYEDLYPLISEIFSEIKRNGDQALFTYTENFDKIKLDTLAISNEELLEAENLVDPTLKLAIQQAKRNIETFHQAQKTKPVRVETMPGVVCEQRKVAIEKVGIYIPGGSAPLFSTVLMLAIPAQIAGCQSITLCTPPNKSGKIDPAILYTASLCGVKNLFKVGGAQAIAALTYGTESIPAVDKIFGPGNQFVTVAKQFSTQQGVAIDMPAGPSELLVFADETCIPEFVAADLLSQAEHGPDSQVLLVLSDSLKLKEIEEEIESQLTRLPRKEITAKALENSRVVLFDDRVKAANFINHYAPEHYIIASANPDDMVQWVKNAGSVFIGNYTPESAGDYASGTNHTLPTNGFAKQYSGVNLDSYTKAITFQRVSPQGIRGLGPIVEEMASAELLNAHENAVSLRLKRLSNQIKENDEYDIDVNIREHLRESEVYSSARSEFSDNVVSKIWLDANENPFDGKATRYPDPYQLALKSRIGELWGVRKDTLFIGNGSDEVLDLIMQLVVEPKQHNALTFKPSYGMYSVLADKNDVELISVPLNEEFEFDWDLFESKISGRTQLVFLCNPNNPTGALLDSHKLLSFIKKTNALVVVDEAYIDFSKEESMVNLVNEHSNLIVVRTLSKAYGLAGARLGVAVANPKIIGWLNRIKPPYNISRPNMDLALERLTNYSTIQKEIEILKDQRALLMVELKKCSWIAKVHESEANFILIKVDDASKRYRDLVDAGIVVRNRSSQYGCENMLRITVGTPDENKRIIKLLKS
jgi:histidinol-phosphate aminotransferase